MINIYYKEEEDIVYWELSGDIYREDLINSIDKIVELYRNREEIKILHIVNNVTANFSPIANVKNFLYAKDFFSLYSSIKIAFVTKTPKNMAFFILGINAVVGEKLKSKNFSSVDSAKEWLISNEL